MDLQKYLENFYVNGYYSLELVFVQNFSKFPINENILEKELKIKSDNERKLIMHFISSYSMKYIAKIKNNLEINQKENNAQNEKINNNTFCNIF